VRGGEEEGGGEGEGGAPCRTAVGGRCWQQQMYGSLGGAVLQHMMDGSNVSLRADLSFTLCYGGPRRSPAVCHHPITPVIRRSPCWRVGRFGGPAPETLTSRGHSVLTRRP